MFITSPLFICGEVSIRINQNLMSQAAGLEDIRRVSKINRASFEEYEQKFQELEDWPGIKPKPMDPLKVLDID